MQTDARSLKSKSSKNSRNAKNVLGFRPVAIEKLKVNAENAKKWLNFHVFAQKISDFPNDIIESNG